MNPFQCIPSSRGATGLLTRVALALLVATGAGLGLSARQAPPAQAAERPARSTDQLDQLVAPIALYPDSLVAQILAASTYPEQVVEAERWVQAHPELKGEALGRAVDRESWDPSVKALTAFPAVLGNMDKNLSWTSSLGDAYFNQQEDIMGAVQVMRRRASDGGRLRSTPQQTVASRDSSITIEPAQADEVYVPAYDPWVVYGDPVAAWPGWYPYPGIYFNGPSLSFGLGLGIGWFGGFGWGWHNWGFDWHNRYAMYNHGRYYSGSHTFYNRGNYFRGGQRGVTLGGNRSYTGRPGNISGRQGQGAARPFGGNAGGARGYAEPRGEAGVRSGAFSGIQHGGETRGFSARGGSSMGGGRRGGGSQGGGRHR